MTRPDLEYCDKVLSCEIVACRFVKLACERHLDDLKYGYRRGLYFDVDAAEYRLDFYKFCHHFEGEWEGQVIEPELWQKFIKYALYGWMKEGACCDLEASREKGFPVIIANRRFRTALIEVARKNGKSTDSATDGLYLFVADGEPGAQVYTAATKKKQAAIVHQASVQMVKKSPHLSKRIGTSKLGPNIFNLHIIETASKYEPLGKDSDTEDGLNVHGAIVDEVHAHKDRGMWDVLDTATGSRRQSLIIGITTSGFDQNGIGYELHEYAAKILKGFNDDSFFAIIFTLDLKKDWPDLKTAKEYTESSTGEKEDDWQDEKVWIKPNPNLGVSVKIDDLRRKAKKASEIPAAQNNFLTKHMNCWTQQHTRWIDLNLWDQNYIKEIYIID